MYIYKNIFSNKFKKININEIFNNLLKIYINQNFNMNLHINSYNIFIHNIIFLFIILN